MQAPRKLKDLFYPARGDLPLVTFREAGHAVHAYIPDDEVWGLTREVVLQRIYDPPQGLPSGLVVDAGAHVGLFTLMAAQHASRVISIEPDPVNYRVLQLNAARNSLGNVTTVNGAVWHEPGTLSFARSWHTTGGHVGGDGGVEVDAVSLDDIIDEHGPIDLLKLDIEGAEEQVLPAMKRLRDIRRIVAELHLYKPGDERAVLDPLERAGFDTKIVAASELYRARHVRSVLRNWRSVEGRLGIKLGVLLYLLAPLEKPRRPEGSRDMPLLLADRR